MSHGEYRVVGRRAYRGHAPGSTFEAVLDKGAEGRAIARGDIVLVKRIRISIRPGSFVLPIGWTDGARTARNRQEASA